MIRLKLMSIMVNDQDRARRFYTGMLGTGSAGARPGVSGASWRC